ncbi:MAG TPA: TPM domain-containing protein [Chitinophagaceae bacterium]|nr:TPM domain-containing protein [Chitinophagaceae bacterium]
MRNALFVIFLIISVQTSAQSYVLDKEQYLNAEEIARVDSMLAAFHKKTGSVVLMSTDSLDIKSPLYTSEIYQRYFPDSTSSTRILMLLMSRKNQYVTMVASKPLATYISQQQMLDMIFAGAPALQAKRREEGVVIILKKAMEALEKH